MKNWLIFLLCVSLILTGTHVEPAGAQVGSDGRKVLVEHSDSAALEWLRQNGAQQLAQYDSFSLWRLPPANGPLPDLVLNLQTVAERIHLRGQSLEPTGLESLPPDTRISLNSADISTGGSFWMVQFIGPVQDDWLARLQSAGLETVAYLPDNAYVVWGQQPAQTLADLASRENFIEWTGEYRPEYRLSSALAAQVSGLPAPAASEPDEAGLLAVTVQIYPHSGVQHTLSELLASARQVLQPPETIAGFTNLSLRLPAEKVSELAARPDVFNIEAWQIPAMLDEAQGQLLAGNLVYAGGKTVPSGPGYLEWLSSLGFPGDPNRYPLVDVVDDGVDSGSASAILHPDFYQYGSITNSDRIAYLVNCTGDARANGVNGHGNLNAGIVGGYNARSGFPFEDSQGYQYGLGISPYGRLAGTKIFSNSGTFDLSRCGGYYTGLIAVSASSGAAITSNSWGSTTSLGAYTVSAQIYDSLTRDASAALPGSQPILHIFSAGNSGPEARTITPPGTAKNVLTVGASENTRDATGQDSCGHTNADSADDIAGFSSRGPLPDGRIKPDLVAPGVLVQGPASQDLDYTGLTVCGKFYPAQQTLYTWSSGTSHAAPAVAGAAQLAYEYYGRIIKPGSSPSPAMLKALLIHSARYLNSTGENLPGAAQGWGSPNLSQLFDGQPRYILDQSHILGSSGNEFSVKGGIANPARPLRVTLVWTDAPGATTGAAYVNNLDLEVSVGGKIYKGNVFNGGQSIPGGSFDPANNVENVFLPPGLQGAFQVRVIARNIAGDGVPGNADTTDQDFALIITNGDTSLAPNLSLQRAVWQDSGGQIPAAIEPGETVDLYLVLANHGNLLASFITSKLAVTGGQASIQSGSASYPDIPAGHAASNSLPFRLTVAPGQTCGQEIRLAQTVQFYPSRQVSLPVVLTTGFTWSSLFSAVGLPKLIPDWPGSAASSPITITIPGLVLDADVLTSISHPRASELAISLAGPGSTPVTLSSGNGGSAANYNQTIFDDQAALSIIQGTAPFTGSYRPQQSISAFDGKPMQGEWQLRVSDQAAGNSGQITQFSLSLRFATCDPAFYQSLKRVYLPMLQR